MRDVLNLGLHDPLFTFSSDVRTAAFSLEKQETVCKTQPRSFKVKGPCGTMDTLSVCAESRQVV